MIAKLKGIVDSVGDDGAVIDVNGVGYLVFCSGRTLQRLEVGAAAALEIETHVREDHIHLYGFSDKLEREWFRLLTTVQGVGARVGLAILSVVPPETVGQAIAAQDKAPLTCAAGVGPKLAGRIVSELKDKAAGVAASFQPTAMAASVAPQGNVAPTAAPVGAEPGEGGAATLAANVTEDATSALVNLGYKRMDAYSAVARAARDQGDGATTQSLITAALRDLAQV
ncbi:Holliday junction DNA helicase RuvA [Caenispirillum salinarum AK4]|uniref:Holliday junction branch migration complex subunit RuvA n=1 Tax=Caenispirillum salinarum AK4 TaxID=1238182 RepID=K9H2R6_9PROT|nr:Holliday junction branch migration protein RuvA [Caenispirillum salinarum]EKV31354.1 Holliday junction DNA helicase RuvA [Caenispirillum salinarum AK4]